MKVEKRPDTITIDGSINELPQQKAKDQKNQNTYYRRPTNLTSLINVVTKTKICETEDTEGNVHAGYHEIRENKLETGQKINPSTTTGVKFSKSFALMQI